MVGLFIYKGWFLMKVKMTVARAMVEVLKSEGVEIIFGIPGRCNLSIL